MANNWKKKFDDAEVMPNPRVWDRIAADLNAAAPAPRSSFPSYLAWAAAIAVFALSGMFVWYTAEPTESSEMAQVESVQSFSSDQSLPKNPITATSSLEAKKSTQGVASIATHAETKKKARKKRDGATLSEISGFSEGTKQEEAMLNETSVASLDGMNEPSNEIVTSTIGETTSTATNDLKAEVAEMKTTPAAGAKFEYPEAEDFLIVKKKKSKSSDKRLWVGVAQGVGSYSSQLNGTSGGGDSGVISPFTTDRTAEDLQTKEQSMNEQMTLSTGVFVGVPLASRLAVVTGLSYNKSNFSSAANTLNGELLHFTADFIENVDIGKVEEVGLNGTYEMAVLPVLADYTVASGAFDWSFQAGPEVGFLLRQQISNDQLGMSRTTRPGDLYRPLHLRVAVGTTLSYEVNSHFQVSFQPIVEQAVTSITAPGASFESYPLNYSALLGFRYSFN